MINGIIGRKVGMTQMFAEDGTVTPVTVVKAGPCVVVQTKSASGRDGYNAVQLGLDTKDMDGKSWEENSFYQKSLSHDLIFLNKIKVDIKRIEYFIINVNYHRALKEIK